MLFTNQIDSTAYIKGWHRYKEYENLPIVSVNELGSWFLKYDISASIHLYINNAKIFIEII
jgi:hypothetical protein